MSSQPIISARGVAKQFSIGARVGSYGSLRESLSNLVRAPLDLVRGKRAPATSTFWALEDVSFDIARGEAVGIVGRNGAGKSTLLKILSRITAPTRGEIQLRGRVASLLEVGTGFHPELTGRENVYLNGAVMGMSRAEIKQSFDEIVSFAELDQFLDTPVKRYSSGMYVRLAFAVAAHLRPEILIIDEVLAVGDAQFQKKCLGKMQSSASGGRTVLFVSHNMAAVSRLCARAILLKQGKVMLDGRVDSVIGEYLRGGSDGSPTAFDWEANGGRIPGNEHIKLLAARLSSRGMENAVVDIRQPLVLEMDWDNLQDKWAMHASAHFYAEDGTLAFITNDSHDPEKSRPLPRGRYRSTLTVPGNLFGEGMYSIDLCISTHVPLTVHFWERGALTFQVHDPGKGDSARGTFSGPFPGATRPLLPWHTEPLATRSKAVIG